MWGKPPFAIADNFAVDVQNLDAARDWYKEKLKLSEMHTDRSDDSGRPFVDLHVPGSDTLLSLIELEADAATQKQHVILFAKNLDKAHDWLTDRGISVGPITSDSGGNRLFRFQDLDGNSIEVCVEP